MSAWIGGAENLRDGDVITDWSHTESGGITLQVNRIDPFTARAVMDFVEKRMGASWDTFEMARDYFGVKA